jgi:predicted PurR-regulated permease PerM
VKRRINAHYFFFGLLAFFLYYFYAVAKPFLPIFIWAAIVVVTLYPVYEKVLKWTKGRKSLSAFITLVGFVIGLIIPLMVLCSILARQAYISKNGIPKEIMNFWTHPQVIQIRKTLNITEDSLHEAGKAVFNFLYQQGTILVSTLLQSLLQFALMLIVVYYFFKFGDEIVEWVRELLPFREKQEDRFMSRISDVVRATMTGNFITVLLQGFLAGVGFLILGFSSPLVWAVLTAFAALVPAIGAALIWLPTALYLLFAGQTWQGIFLGLWGLIVLGMMDNVIKPLIIQGKIKLHSAVILFSLMGGISAFGIAGFVLGPLIVSLTFALLEQYRESYSPKEPLPEIGEETARKIHEEWSPSDGSGGGTGAEPGKKMPLSPERKE